MNAPNWIGRGIRWPLTTDGTGGIATTTNEPLIEQSIRIIIGTAPGDYVMWPEFGCRAHERVFDPNDPDTVGLLVADVRDALMRYEPRIEVGKITGERRGNAVELRIAYTIRATRDERVMTYPFYLEGSDA